MQDNQSQDEHLREYKQMYYSLLSSIEQMGQPSFKELATIDGFKGDFVFGRKDLNIVFWGSVSPIGGTALLHLMHDGAIAYRLAHPAIYWIDNAGIDLPLATEIKHYDGLRWMPLKFRISNEKGDA